jgi:hypothetical protein
MIDLGDRLSCSQTFTPFESESCLWTWLGLAQPLSLLYRTSTHSVHTACHELHTLEISEQLIRPRRCTIYVRLI